VFFCCVVGGGGGGCLRRAGGGGGSRVRGRETGGLCKECGGGVVVGVCWGEEWLPIGILGKGVGGGGLGYGVEVSIWCGSWGGCPVLRSWGGGKTCAGWQRKRGSECARWRGRGGMCACGVGSILKNPKKDTTKKKKKNTNRKKPPVGGVGVVVWCGGGGGKTGRC